MASLDIINAKNSIVTFITEDMIKVATPMSANKVQTSLINSIVLAQKLHIRKILGKTLYNKLMAEWIIANFDSDFLPSGDGVIPPIILGDTTDYKQLYLEIVDPLIWWSYILSLPGIAFQVTEKGIVLNSTEFSSTGGVIGLDRLVNEGSAVARSFTQDLLEYICLNFKSDADVQDESTKVGGSSLKIFTARKNWSSNNNCC